jgi:hypothetical protein
MTSNVTVHIGFEQALIAMDTINSDMRLALAESIDPLLDFVEAGQIHKYTQDADPTKPEGTPYVRTFDLRNSSEKSHAPGALNGEWRATIDYAQYVLGTRAQQALIHQDRWLPTETVEQLTIAAAPGIINDQVEKRFR